MIRTELFDLGHQYKAREARDHFREVLDTAENGNVAVVRRATPVVVVMRDALDEALRVTAPLEVRSAVKDGQVVFWLEDAPVLASGADLDSAEDAFLEALVDYAELWFDELRDAPNHRQNKFLALRVAAFAGDLDELRQVVFGDD